MLAINLNSKLLNPSPEMPLSHRLLRRLGMDMYMEGRQLSDCLTADERAGYMEALRAEADCETAGYLAESVN